MKSHTIKVLIAVVVVVVCGLLFWWRDIASDRDYQIEVLVPTTLLKTPPHLYPETNVEVGRIEPGEAVQVLRMRYGKDFRAWLVRGAHGQEGWFIEDKRVKVSSKSP